MKMHHRDNIDSAIFLGVQDSIRESPYQRPPDLAPDNWPSLWEGDRSLNSRVDLNRKIPTEARLYLLVIVYRLVEFSFRFRVERKGHSLNRRQIFSKTWSPGTGLTEPDLISRSRL